MTEKTEKPENDRDPLGSAAEEALKLFDALQQRAARELRKNLVRGTMSGFGSAFSGGSERGGGRDVWGRRSPSTTNTSAGPVPSAGRWPPSASPAERSPTT